MLSLRRLQHFVVLSEESAISRAARRLHLTQPALTRSIRTLEEALGLVLFDRHHDGVSLTDAGQAMLMRARRMLGDVDAMQSEADQIRGVEVGQVRFGVGILPATIFLADVLSQQIALRPQLLVQVDIESWVRLHDKLQRDELDFAVAMTRSLPPGTGFEVKALPPLHIGYFVRAGHPLAGRPSRSLRARLHEFPLLSSQMPPRARAGIATLYQLPSDQEVQGLRCDNVDVLRQIVLQTDGVLFSCRETLQADIDGGRLVPLPLLSAQESRLGLSMIRPQRRTPSPATVWMMALIRDRLARGERR